jgi:hypothetical protein
MHALPPPLDLEPLLLGKVGLGGKGRCLSAAFMALAIFLSSEKRSVCEGELVSKMLQDDALARRTLPTVGKWPPLLC